MEMRTLAGLLAAATATVAILGSVTALFDSAGSTPWVPAHKAAYLEVCNASHSSQYRHDCLRALLAKGKTGDRVASKQSSDED